MRDYKTLLKDKVLNAIGDSWETKEIIKDLNEEMIVKVINQSRGEMYYAFDEVKKEHSRVRFLKLDKFPDFFILLIDPNGKIHWHICELKRSPAKKGNLEQLRGQLFSGYMHAKLLLSALHAETQGITYHYHVFMVRDRDKESDYNRQKTAKKITPGVEMVPPNLYEQWLDDYLEFTDGNVTHKMRINKHGYDENVNGLYYYTFAPPEID